MKGLTIWLLKKVCGIDVDSLQSENKRLREEIGRHVYRTNSLKKEKESLSEIVMRLQEDNTSLENKNQNLNSQIDRLQNQIKELKDELKKNEEDYKSSISQLSETLDKTQQENAGLKTSIDGAKKEIESLNEQLQTSSTPVESGGDDEALDEIENLKRQYVSLQDLYEQAKEENKMQNARISKQDSTIDNLKKTIREQGETIEAKSKEIAKIKKEQQSSGTDIISNVLEKKVPVDELSPIPVSHDITIVIEDSVIGNNSEKSKDSTKRTIDTVIDLENDKEIYAKQFFSQPESIIFKKRTELEKAIYLRKPMYVCKYCGQMVKISGRKTERGLARFFSHLRDSDDCDYKTTTGRTRREINREKFARCNEGERHKFLKAEIAKYLEMTNGVTNVRTENTIKGNHPILRWRRPDVIANYRGQEVVFELQLSTTFVSVIAERDLFYRLNQKHIIWVSNFDEQGEHVDLTNMMVKDIYYNNRMNLFIFDLDAQRKSEELGELVLKCNWITPDGSWQYPNGNTSDKLGGKYIRLSDLKFDNTYKPYYEDAEQAYFAAHPEFKIKVVSIEEENKEILAELDRQWEEELSREETEQQKTEEKIQEIVEDNEIDGDVKPTKKYIIAQRLGQYGLITYDGLIRLPFIYDEIKTHRGWYEGKRNGIIEVFASNYELIDKDIRRIEKMGDNYKKYVKENGGDWLWGIMDKNAKPITLPIFSKIGVWSSDKFIAVQDGQYCILNQNGHIIISGYDHISELDNEGMATILKDGREGRIDSECQAIKSNTERISDSISKINKLGKWGLENNDGIILVPCEYDDLGSFNNGIIGLKGIRFSQLNVSINTDCPVRVKYISRNERKMLIFKVGNREAFMNLRQQQKAAKNGLKPMELTQMYFSHANEDKNLLYLSATPVKTVAAKHQIEVKDSDIPIGSVIEGSIAHVDKNSFIIKTEDNQTAYLHRSTWGEYSMEQFNKGQMVKVEKTGFDSIHNKHVWKILAVYWPMTSNVETTF
ncbi:MAG: WG repeat-containing protein [Prevotella sp.]|nr:WG repeat-containing protein [Prevotella sp.]